MSTKATAMPNYSEIVGTARRAFNSGITRPLSFRKTQLKKFMKLLNENEDLIIKALHEDLKKPKFESYAFEIEFARNDIRGCLYELDHWAKKEPASPNLALVADDLFVLSEPYGVALIMGAWNYPLQLSISPMIGAIAAGNAVVLKPSDLAPAVGKLLEELIPRYLNRDVYQVVNGGVPETTALLKERFDYIFYTGSTTVGKIIHTAAAAHLTPTTLELGGKSPVYIDSSVNLPIACRRITWGKYVNAGQTCVAPDYVLCQEEIYNKVLENLKKAIKEMFGDNPRKTQDFGRIINQRHFQRIKKLLASGKIAVGGECVEDELYIAPTILTNVSFDDPVMQEEIFGPILPMIPVSSPEEAIKFINQRDKPLSLYVYSTKKSTIDKFLYETSSGSVCVNDNIIQLSADTLPFGGVGASGMGNYHGKYSFDTFSHKKAVLKRSYNTLLEPLSAQRFAPYTESKQSILRFLMLKRKSYIPEWWPYVLCFALGVAAVFIAKVVAEAAGKKGLF